MNYNSESGLGPEFDTFADKNVRLGKFLEDKVVIVSLIWFTMLGFIRKVYGILSVQLLLTFGFVCALSAR